MPNDRFAARRERLLRRLKTAGVEALLVTSPFNVRYLTGFTGEDSELVIGRKLAILVSDSRFETQIQQECPSLEAYIRATTQTRTEALAQVVSNAKLNVLGFESRSTTYAQWESLQAAVKGLQLVPQTDQVEALRMIKDASEVAQIWDAIRQAERGFNLLRASLRDDMSELQAANDLEHGMRRFGARGASFETIVAAGPRAALPHARPTATRIGDADFVLVDWGATNGQGYRSDLTRILVTGTISPKLEKLYGVVLSAQRRAVEAIGPGVPAAQIDSIARDVIAKAGWGKNFGHGLGHGIGLEIHEGPRLSRTSKDVLQAGMVVTVEPGIYLPGWGGIRIEDDVLVTRTGHEVLTSLPNQIDRQEMSL
jgi:Xaa-Pro aminopeptidase